MARVGGTLVGVYLCMCARACARLSTSANDSAESRHSRALRLRNEPVAESQKLQHCCLCRDEENMAASNRIVILGSKARTRAACLIPNLGSLKVRVLLIRSSSRICIYVPVCLNISHFSFCYQGKARLNVLQLLCLWGRSQR